MSHVDVETMHMGRPPVDARESRGSRRRWFRVRVVTEDGAYVGSLRLEPGCSGLRRLLDDDRAYLSLWDVRREGSAAVEEFVALHKVGISYAVVIGRDAAAGAGGGA